MEHISDLERARARVVDGPPPDAVLLDLGGGGTHALQFLHHLRGALPRETLYVIALIDQRDEAVLLPLAMKAGIDDWLARPALPEALWLRLLICQRVRGLADDPLDASSRLRFLATHDSLTGLWNRASMAGHLYRAMARSARDGSLLAFIMCDVDHFKHINDSHGHAVGDEVLRVVAQRLRGVVRPHDLVGRYGGEEFVILVPGCSVEMSFDIAERARRAVCATPVSTCSGSLVVTVSVGIANLTDLGRAHAQPAPQDLMVAADQAMYRAKGAGRNRVVAWPPDRPTQATTHV